METEDISESDKQEMMKFADINQENVVEKYSQVAEKYDHTIEEVLGYPDPAQIHEMLVKYGIPKEAAILDLGCGTGLLGKELIEKGYTNIVGIDASPEMLEKAEAKGYKELKEVFLCSNSFPEEYTGKFDLAVSVGLLGHHLPTEVLDEKISCFRPKESEDDKRFIIFTTREACMEEYGYNKKLKQLEDEGKVKFVENFSWTKYENLEIESIGMFWPLQKVCYVYSV